MALDYRKIRKDKEQEYGTKVANYGRLLANLYSDYLSSLTIKTGCKSPSHRSRKMETIRS